MTSREKWRKAREDEDTEKKVNKNSNNRIEEREGKGNKTGVGECRGEWKRGREEKWARIGSTSGSG
jgi:hypothetical protein